MKKIILTLGILISLLSVSFGQWTPGTNTTLTSGNVGIGTTTPNYKFQIGKHEHGSVSGTTDAFFAGTKFNMNLFNDEAYNVSGLTGAITFGSKYSSSYYTPGVKIYGFRPNYQTNNNYEYALGIETREHGQAMSRKLTIKGNGNVGIGTANPLHKLQVEGSARFTMAGTRNLDLLGWTLAGPNGVAIAASSTTGSGHLPLAFAASNFYFHAGGVGIGTTKVAGYKLSVEGKMRAREIEVNALTWADFVFAEDYELKSLEEVERFIEKNNHLPNVPSEKEVTEEGINLGEMDAILLRKIEELTLYMIQMKKENEELRILVEKK